MPLLGTTPFGKIMMEQHRIEFDNKDLGVLPQPLLGTTPFGKLMLEFNDSKKTTNQSKTVT